MSICPGCKEAMAANQRFCGFCGTAAPEDEEEPAEPVDAINGICRVIQEMSDLQVAAVGDDLPDLPMLVRIGFSACPADAAPEVAVACHLVCGAQGGRGAVREVAELILKAQSRWTELVGAWLPREAGEPPAAE